MKKIRVLHIGLSRNIGGIETVVHSWYERKPDDIAFDFINNLDCELAFEDEFRSNGSKIHYIPARKKDPLRSYLALNRIIAEYQYDYLHYHAMSLSWAEPTIIAASSKKTKPIIHSHCVVPDCLPLKDKALHSLGKLRLSKHPYLKLACGQEAGKSMFGQSGFEVIYNGIDIGAYAFSENSRQKVRERYRVPEDTFLIGHVGKPGAQKNYPFLLKTVCELIRAGVKCKLMLIGALEGDAKIKQLVSDLEIQSHVILTGCVKEPRDYYAAMDCFFLPSLYEGFSVALIEAQAAALPCVVSRNIAVESKLTDDFLFVDLDTIEGAKSALLHFYHHPHDRTKVLSNPAFDVNMTSNKLFTFYRENLSRE